MGDGPPPVYDPHKDWKTAIEAVPQQTHTYGNPNMGAASGGPGFKYDEATLHELAKDWSELAADYRLDREQANNIAQTRGPGKEYASGGNAELIRYSGSALLTTLDKRVEYCQAMASKYVAALGKYARAEDTHATEIKQTGGSL